MRIYPLGEQAHNLIAALEAADNAADASDGVVDDQVELLLDEADRLMRQLAYSLVENGDEIARVLIETRAAADERKRHAQAAAKRAQRADGYAMRLRAIVTEAMVAAGIKRVGVDHDVRIAAHGGLAPLIIDDDAVPPGWRKQGPPDATRIRQALTEGEPLDFARIGERGVGLRVK